MSTASPVNWFKSTYSSASGDDCVEVAESPSAIHVRDSKDKSGPQLAFGADAWTAFVEFAKQH